MWYGLFRSVGMVRVVTATCFILATSGLHAQTLQDAGLAAALRNGGYVLVMRHASSPTTPPDRASADPENVAGERQLDETGRRTAMAMGEAIKRLQIPVGEVFSSPAYRARETIRLALLGTPQLIPELDIGTQGITSAGVAEPREAWLRNAVARLPAAHYNTVIVTHAPNLMAAFPDALSGLAEGETIVFQPDQKGGTVLVARVKIGDWPRLALQTSAP